MLSGFENDIGGFRGVARQAAAEVHTCLEDGLQPVEIVITPEIARTLKKVARRMDRQQAKEGRMRSTTETYIGRIEAQLGKALGKCTTGGGGLVQLTLVCEDGHEVEWSSTNRIPGEAIATKLKKMGWRLGRHPRCPEHNGHGAQIEEVQEDDMERREPVKLRPVLPPKSEEAAAEEARQAKRNAIAWLQESVDEKTAWYKEPSVTDKIISSDTGLSEQTVANLRVELYGPRKEPSEIDALRTELQMLRDRQITALTAFEKQANDLSDKIDALVKANGWQS